MTAYFCPKRRAWSDRACRCDDYADDKHLLRHVGPDKIVQLMNAIELSSTLIAEDSRGSRAIQETIACAKWMH